MSVDRRFVLKSVALGSLTGLTMGVSLSALAGRVQEPAVGITQPVLALVTPGMDDSAFVRGARRAAGTSLRVRQVGHELDFLLGFERRMRDDRSLRVIGLLDDAAAVLMVDLARSAGARVQWLGQHTMEAGSMPGGTTEMDIASLGHRLGSLGERGQALASRVVSGAIPLRGSFVSFSIQG